MKEIYAEEGIKSRKGAGKYTKLVKLLFGAQRSATANRYAKVLRYARHARLDGDALVEQLRMHGMNVVNASKAKTTSDHKR